MNAKYKKIQNMCKIWST